jgi:hypothetical protein
LILFLILMLNLMLNLLLIVLGAFALPLSKRYIGE